MTSETVPLTKTGVFEIMFVRFTVGAPGCTCPGNMDGNAARDGRDIAGFVSAVIAGSGACADANGDTSVTNDDIAPFINLILTGAGCP